MTKETKDMNTTACKKCGVQFAKSRPKCPECGYVNSVANHVSGSMLLLTGIVVPIAIWGMATKSYLEMLGLVILVSVIGGIAAGRVSAKRQTVMEKQLGELPDFTVTQMVVKGDGNGLAIDENSLKLCLIDSRYEIPEFRVISYKDIISCELFQDGSTVTKTIRSSQIGGALIGGLALGGIGAVIGGLSGKTKTTEKVRQIDLRIIVNDMNAPLHDVRFLSVETNKEGLVGGNYYEKSLHEARHWHGLVEILIRRADTEDKQLSSSTAQMAQPSFSDEIKKLAALRDSGVLTDEEFKIQKRKMLGV